MTRTSSGWTLVIAALGMTAGLLGAEISGMESWETVAAPAFIGKSLAHLATVIAAYVGGQLVPTAERFR